MITAHRVYAPQGHVREGIVFVKGDGHHVDRMAIRQGEETGKLRATWGTPGRPKIQKDHTTLVGLEGGGLANAIVGTLLAYVIMRGKFPGKHVMEMVALSGFALPGTVIGVGYIMAFNRPPFLLTILHRRMKPWPGTALSFRGTLPSGRASTSPSTSTV